MRCARLGALGLLLACAVGQAQTTPHDSTVVVPEVEARGGPSPEFYATGKLRQGQTVSVVGEENGYLAIVPPVGSFCWIENRVLKVNPTGKTAIVDIDDVPVRIGSDQVAIDKLVVARYRLNRGAQVAIVGLLQGTPDGASWMPIQPPPQDVRYIPREAVRVTQVVENVAPPPPAATSPLTDDALRTQAEQAEAARNLPLAIDLYNKLAAQTADANLRNACYNRIQFLHNPSAVASVPPGYQPNQPAQAQYGENRAPVAATLTSNIAQTPGQLASYAPQPALQRSGPGHLRKAAFWLDGRQAYVLTDSLGRVLMYVTVPSGGVNLEAYVGQAVDLSGSVVYRGDLRTNYIVVSQVSVLNSQ